MPTASRTPEPADVVVGIDIGGTGTRFIAADPRTLTVTAQVTVPTPNQGTATEILAFFTQHVEKVSPRRRPSGIGVGASGPVDVNGIIRNPDTLPAFTNLPLPTMIGSLTDGPVVIDNDAVCAAIAEHRVGAAQNSFRSLHVTLGTGVGVCLLEGNQPFRNHDGGHPEGGHISISTPSSPCYCGRHSCWEQAASRRALQEAAAVLVRRPAIDHTVLPELAARAEQQEPAALAIYHHYGLAVADGLSTLLTLYAPTVVVMGGSGSERFDLYHDSITQSLDRLAGWIAPHHITRTWLDDYGGAIGGAGLASRHLQTNYPTSHTDPH